MLRFSRHARNRMKLYGIATEDVAATIGGPESVEEQESGSVALRRFPGKYNGYPLKVVWTREGADSVVVTTYPLKKKAWG